MSRLEAVLLIPTIAAALILAGYGLAARVRGASPAERLALASLAGLAFVLWNLSVINFFLPLRNFAAWLSFWPVLLTWVQRGTRKKFAADLTAVSRSRHLLLAAAGGGAFLVFLFWPIISRPELIYFDGTSNHDGYFWISAARQLQTHSYMDPGLADPSHPWLNLTGTIHGWKPMWGRAGSESLLATIASVTTASSLAIYLPTVTALFISWAGAVYLVARTFFATTFSRAAIFAIVALQPMFVFFEANGNLPNLLGILAGALVVVATEQSLRSPADRFAWLAILAGGVSALLYAYPEIAPFIALPAGLLIARTWFSVTNRPATLPTCSAVLAGLLLNPATTVRATSGFIHSFESARLNYEWANIFDRLDPARYAPSLATLSVQANEYFGQTAGIGATVGLLLASALVIIRARDRFGALATLTGGAALLAYTAVADFSYGLQKSAQFSAIFVAALIPVGALNLTARPDPRRWHHALAGIVAAIFVTSLVFHGLEIDKWSRRKAITSDWTSLTAFARASLPNTPVLIEPATFDESFFYGMWATYFLRENPVIFSARGDQNGGYLHESVKRESASAPVFSEPVLVSREWADTFDANSVRLFSSNAVVLLESANRILRLEGVQPAQGVPQTTGPQIKLDVQPQTRSTLRFELTPLTSEPADTSWHVNCRVGTNVTFSTTLGGSPPWRVQIPLVGGSVQHIDLAARGRLAPADESMFAITGIRMTSTP